MTAAAFVTFASLLEMIDRLAVAMARHERAEELYKFFDEAYRVERRLIEMEAQLVEAERLGEQ